ncbi:hypothetical protein Pcinc_018228, partial [Petrolisthes cinctipes]
NCRLPITTPSFTSLQPLPLTKYHSHNTNTTSPASTMQQLFHQLHINSPTNTTSRDLSPPTPHHLFHHINSPTQHHITASTMQQQLSPPTPHHLFHQHYITSSINNFSTNTTSTLPTNTTSTLPPQQHYRKRTRGQNFGLLGKVVVVVGGLPTTDVSATMVSWQEE